MIKCNQCLACPSAGPCFRTACRHLLCEKCAKEAFTSHSYCPSCNTQLRPQDVVEFLIGVPPVGLHETIFQIALQDTAFEAIVENCNKVMQYVTELMAFVQSQILMEQQTEASARAQIEAGHDSYKNESVRRLIHPCYILFTHAVLSIFIITSSYILIYTSLFIISTS